MLQLGATWLLATPRKWTQPKGSSEEEVKDDFPADRAQGYQAFHNMDVDFYGLVHLIARACTAVRVSSFHLEPVPDLTTEVNIANVRHSVCHREDREAVFTHLRDGHHHHRQLREEQQDVCSVSASVYIVPSVTVSFNQRCFIDVF